MVETRIFLRPLLYLLGSGIVGYTLLVVGFFLLVSHPTIVGVMAGTLLTSAAFVILGMGWGWFYIRLVGSKTHRWKLFATITILVCSVVLIVTVHDPEVPTPALVAANEWLMWIVAGTTLLIILVLPVDVARRNARDN